MELSFSSLSFCGIYTELNGIVQICTQISEAEGRGIR